MADLKSVSIQVTPGNDNDHEFQKFHNNTKNKRSKRNARSKASKDNAKSRRTNQISPSRKSKSMNTIESQDETHRLAQRTSEQSNTQGQSKYYSNSIKHDAATIVNQETSNIAFKCSAEKFLKICFASIMFLIALSSGFVSRITLHILIWHMNPPVQSNRSQINVLCGMLEPNCSSCYNENNCTKYNKHSHSEATDGNWIWAVFLVMIAPYFITFLETFFRICFKSNKKIDIAVLISIMFIETVHSFGISILVFLVLPSFDPVSASVLFLAVAFLPPLINLIDHAVLQNQRTKQKHTKTLWQPYILSIIGVICQLAGIILIAFYIEIDWLYCLFVLGAVCVSIKYWENFITNDCGDTSNKHDNSSTSAEHLSTNGSDSPKATRSTDVENPVSSEQNNINESSFSNEPSNIGAGGDGVTSETKVNGHESRVNTSASDSNHAKDRELKGSSEQRKVKESSVSKKFYFRVVSPSELKLRYHQSRTKITCLVNLWKIVFTFVAVIAIFASRSGNSNDTFQALFNNGNAMFNTIFGEKEINDSGPCNSYVPFVLTIVNIVCSYVYYKATKTSCVIFCQRFGFCIPLLALPLLSTGSLIGLLHKPDLLQFESCDILFSDWCVTGENTLVGACKELFIAFFVLYGSMLIITRHVWKVNGYRMSETARVFVSHFYCGVFLDTSLLLNRRRDDEEYDIVLEKSDNVNDYQHRKILYACCATMWHETEKEMDQLLQSIFKLDKKQFLNERLKESLKSDKKNQEEQKEKEEIETFDLEAHLIFDDAFDPILSGQKFPDINRYVKTFINVFYKVGKKIYGNHYVGQGDGTMHTTPYGGRISWSLPGENTLVLHLKDKTKIRNKKRWSQVMYMLKILKWDLKRKSEKMTERSKEDTNKILQSLAENSYILALDGDVDFEPEAVLSLMRRMNKSSKVGAACGRIHPRGSGPMVWYQKFEYAISHWLHKATEHVIGCVLCSPGCFSLFRGAALLHPSVLQKYTKQSSEAKHFIQYDQGEDRWLCTLLQSKDGKLNIVQSLMRTHLHLKVLLNFINNDVDGLRQP
ncbi:uncharacterized protein LOC127710528 [Mytilus californianus]|uniref:uncharacterized protein LOC127710528 n=1 Tax=Mytilus californianus TaxID=6549 RepID=UPI0022475CC0|nr:uncharacterized protein LOC127710528 [Mytilus californianus]